MGVRDWLNEHPKAAVTVAAGAVIATVGVAVALWAGNGAATASGDGVGRAFFSVDDGKTWFPDDASKLPPFSIDGKQALGASVYKCPDGEAFVACLTRYTPPARRELERMYARDGGRASSPLTIKQLELDGLEVKAPGESTWLKRSDPRAADLLTPRCADGSYAQPVMP